MRALGDAVSQYSKNSDENWNKNKKKKPLADLKQSDHQRNISSDNEDPNKQLPLIKTNIMQLSQAYGTYKKKGSQKSKSYKKQYVSPYGGGKKLFQKWLCTMK